MSVTSMKKMKRKHVSSKKPQTLKTRKRSNIENYDISSSESENEGSSSKRDTKEDDFFEESAQDKKIRLTKEYLKQLESLKENESDEEDVVGKKLKDDVLEKAGRLQKKIADNCIAPAEEDIQCVKGHKLSVTCLVVTGNGNIFTGSKDCCIIKWDAVEGKKLKKIIGGVKENPDKTHTSHILCISVTTDNKFLVSGGKDKVIHVWNPEDCSHIHVFKGHRDAVTSVALRLNSHQLFSGSLDRCVKVWDLDMLAYVETLYGHQDGVQACDSLTRERCATAGGRDGSIRIWKIVEESQLLYHGHNGCIDTLKLINEEYMISGSDDGSVCLWSVMKKKPIFTLKDAHKNENSKDTFWISSVAAYINSDLVATGSSNGYVKIWKCSEKFLKLDCLFSIPIKGFANSLQFSPDGKFLYIAVGQEHKLGRWWRQKEAKNSLVIVKISK